MHATPITHALSYRYNLYRALQGFEKLLRVSARAAINYGTLRACVFTPAPQYETLLLLPFARPTTKLYNVIQHNDNNNMNPLRTVENIPHSLPSRLSPKT